MHQLSKTDQECIRAFSTKIDCLGAKNRNDVCVPDTGQWFFGHQSYEYFHYETAPQLLFVTAEAGSGKSTMMRTVIDSLQSSQPSPLVAYFFFKDDNDLLRDYSEALSAVVHQLLIQRSAFAKIALPSYQKYGQAIKSQTGEVWKVLTRFAMHSQDDIVCIFDAIDECEASGRSQLLQDMKAYMQDINATKSRMKFIISSRPYQNRYHPYEDLISCSKRVYHLDGENARFTSDMLNVISFKADELCGQRHLSESTRQLLWNKIRTLNTQTKSFLWVKLAFELLRVDPRLRPGAGDHIINAILAEIPDSIGEQFERLLRTSSDPVHARKLFSVILAARRPLKIAEFKVIFSLTQPLGAETNRPRTYDDLEILRNNDDFKLLVRNTCGLFITFIKGSLHLFHQTAREFLMFDADVDKDDLSQMSHLVASMETVSVSQQASSWKHSITSLQANYVIGKVCLDLICFTASADWVNTIFQRFATGDYRDIVQDYEKTKPFLQYAACNWYEHMMMARNAIEHDVCKRENASMFDISEPQFWLWFLIACDQVCLSKSIHSDRWTDDLTSSIWNKLDSYGRIDRGLFLRSACIHKMSPMDAKVSALFYDDPPPPDTRAIIEGVSWTASNGFHFIDKFHLANGDWKHTSLSKAVSALDEGVEDASRILLEEIPKSTLIWMAIRDGRAKALSKVLADLTDTSWLHSVPEHMTTYMEKQPGLVSAPESAQKSKAARQQEWNEQYPATFDVFIRVNALSFGNSIFFELGQWVKKSSSPQLLAKELWRAGAFICGPLCHTLVDYGAEVDNPLWRDQMTALHVAATFWEHMSLRTLIHLGANVSTLSPNDWNALHWFCSAQGGPTKEGQTNTFQHRYKKAQLQISFNKIIGAATNKQDLIEQQDKEGITPIMLAVQLSSTITYCLLKEGALINQTDNCNRTALMHFFIGTRSWCRPRSVLKRLLQFGADPRMADNKGVTTVSYWARGLLDHTIADLYPGYNFCNTDFHALDNCDALSGPHVMSSYLRPSGIPLVVASRLGNARLSQYLLLNGAAVDEHGMEASSPLMLNNGSVADELKSMSYNPLMVAIALNAYVTAAVLLENGASIDVFIALEDLPSWYEHKAGITLLHLLTAGDTDIRYISDIHMSTGDWIARCGFEPAGRPEQPVNQESGDEAMMKYYVRNYYLETKELSSSESETESLATRSVNDWTGSHLLPYDKFVGDFKLNNQNQDPLFAVIYDNASTVDQRRQAIVEFILRRGANVNARTQKGITPLFSCVQSGRINLAKLLLKYQADVNIANVNGGTPLMWASRMGNRDMVELLLDHGANINAQIHETPPTSTQCHRFQSRFFDKSPRGNGGPCDSPTTALALAAERGHLAVVRLLLDRGADPNIKITHHTHGLLQIKNEKKRRRKTRRATTPPDSDSDADAEPEVWKGYISVGTALTWARGEVRELLLERGADPVVEMAIRECGCVVEEMESDDSSAE